MRLSRRSTAVMACVAFVCSCLSLIVGVPTASAASLPGGFAESTISGLSAPTAMAFAPDGRLFILQQGGQIRVVQNGTLLPAPFASITVDSAGERGLLGIAFPNDFASSHRVYVYFTQPTPASHNVVAWLGGADGNTATTGPNVVVTLPNLSAATNHNGGGMHFSPTDGQLYIGVGENANSVQAQDLTIPLGKMLRVDENGNPSAGNPTFGGAPHDGRVWAYGLRNPFTSAIQPGTGTVFINDVGSSGSGACGSGTWEEINVGAAGANYGWPAVEGPPISAACTKAGVTYPLYTYPHTDPTAPCAIAGGTFYNPGNPLMGQAFVGAYFFSDLCGGWIRYRLPNGTIGDLAAGVNGPVDLQVGPDGALWYLAINAGTVSRIAPFAPAWQVFLRNAATSGASDIAYSYGIKGDDVLFCDWDGNGTDTIGIHRGNMWLLHNANNSGPPDATFVYGDPGDTPVCGNWDGSGGDTVGVRRGNTFFLRNSNSPGAADLTALYGSGDDIPVTGDWTGSGHDSIGVRRSNTFFLRNTNTSGIADTTAIYGNPGDEPIIGDWDGNGSDTIGLHRGASFFLRNSNVSGNADLVALYGNGGDRGAAGDWDGNGSSGIGVYR